MFKVANFQLTNTCNMRCGSCNSFNEKHSHFDFRTFDQRAEEWKKAGVKILSLTGGEPTLYKHIVDLAEAAKDKGFIVHLATNGSNPDKVEELLPYLSAMIVSLDSSDPEVHNKHRGRPVFDSAVDTLKRCRGKVKILTANALITVDPKHLLRNVDWVNDELGIPLSLCYPGSGTYVYGEHQFDMAEVARSFRRAALHYDDYVWGNTKRFYEEAAGTLPRSSCKAGKSACYINTKGELMDCFMKRKRPEGCNECMIQCFREPSISDTYHQAALLWRIYRYTHKRR